MKKHLILLLMLATCHLTASAATGEPDFTVPEGKAVIFFTRDISLNLTAKISLFDGDKLIMRFTKPGYIRYVCEPGQHLFWAVSAMNYRILTDIRPGKIYYMKITPTDLKMTAFSLFRTTFVIQYKKNKHDKHQIELMIKALRKRKLLKPDPKEMEKARKMYAGKIKKTMQKYKKYIHKKHTLYMFKYLGEKSREREFTPEEFMTVLQEMGKS